MDPYATIAAWAGWPVVVGALLLIGGYGSFLFRSHLDLLKEKNEWLEKKMQDLEGYRPDVLAQRLADRLHIVQQELERLHADREAGQQSIREKEADLVQVKNEIAQLTAQLDQAQETISLVSERGLVCPHCGAPLVTHEHFTDLVEYEGRELDVDHEFIAYECGYEIRDGEIIAKCSQNDG
jgi:DNA repair exonuclease SbcCD ATPase subunit